MRTGTIEVRSLDALFRELDYKNEFNFVYSRRKEDREQNLKKAGEYYIIKHEGNWWYATRINKTKAKVKSTSVVSEKDGYIIVLNSK